MNPCIIVVIASILTILEVAVNRSFTAINGAVWIGAPAMLVYEKLVDADVDVFEDGSPSFKG